MRTLKLLLAYDGTNYVGWQRQTNGVSIQQLVEEALSPFAEGQARPAAVGAGRTDAGVHATGQVVSVNVEFDHAPEAVRRALNIRLPRDVRVLEVADAAPGFHARFDAVGKSYMYRIVTSEVASPFDRLFVWHAPGPRDVGAMRAAAAYLIGRRDFASFQTRGSWMTDTVRRIDRLDIHERPGELTIEIDGDGFLRHMVRAIVGTLDDVGVGLRRPESMVGVIEACARRAAGRTAPASGLTLIGVRYC